MLKIHFAPLQGFTDCAYRKVHVELASGVDFYYTPFLRLEKGVLRKKDANDLGTFADLPAGLNLVPQVIAANVDEFSRLVDFVYARGFRRIDLNLGCPFPMQTKSGRGAALLQRMDTVQAIMDKIAAWNDVAFSVKMRIGMESSDEGLSILPLLNTARLEYVAVHPRLGIQQYKGVVDMEAFSAFYERCTQKIVYNGDVKTVEQIRELECKYPKLDGVMIGRGMLANPLLAMEYKTGKELCLEERMAIVLEMHSQLLEYARRSLQGDSQVLAHVRPFWEYQEDNVPKKIFKRIMKSGNLKNYLEAVDSLGVSMEA